MCYLDDPIPNFSESDYVWKADWLGAPHLDLEMWACSISIHRARSRLGTKLSFTGHHEGSIIPEAVFRGDDDEENFLGSRSDSVCFRISVRTEVVHVHGQWQYDLHQLL